MLPDEQAQDGSVFNPGVLRTKVKAGLALLVSKPSRLPRPAFEPAADGENNRPIRVADVPFCPLGKTGTWRFAKMETRGYDAPLTPPALWAPLAVRNPMPDRKVQCRRVGPGLSAADDFLKHGHGEEYLHRHSSS